MRLDEDAFPCGFCSGTIEHGQYARVRRREDKKLVFYHPGCPRRTKQADLGPLPA